MTRASSQGRQHPPRKQDLRQKMMKEPEYEELNIERPNNYNDLNNKHEQLCFREYRPFKCSEPGKVDDDAYLAYDRLLVEILTWLILKRKHLLKFEIKSSIQQIFFKLNDKATNSKKRLLVDKTSLTKPEPEEEPEI